MISEGMRRSLLVLRWDGNLGGRGIECRGRGRLGLVFGGGNRAEWKGSRGG